MTLQNRESGDPIVTAYVVDMTHDVLDRAAELELTRRVVRLRASGGEAYRAAADELARANLRLVMSIARRFAGRGVELSDLIQEGNLGLLRAIERFDPERGTKFSTYAVFWIAQGLRRALDNLGRTIRVPVYASSDIRQLRAIERRLTAETGERPSEDELARESGVEAGIVRRRFEAARVTHSLNDPVADESDLTWADTIVDRSPGPEDAARVAGARAIVLGLLDTLTEREREIIIGRFGLADTEPQTLDELGLRFGVTRERVRQIEAEALERLRHPSRRRLAREALRAIA